MNRARRRFLAIAASASAVAAGSIAAPAFQALASPPAIRRIWRGVALGAHASITLSGPDAGRLEVLTNLLEAEIARLENLFSIYRPASAVSQLNRNGFLPAPPPELLRLMSLATAVHEATGGAFDPTIQPLWQLHAAARSGPDAEPVPANAVREARTRTGWQHVAFSSDRIRFTRRGMALTFNGIAQGFVADRVADLLRRNGFTNVLVDMGEISALGHRRTTEPWHVGIAGVDGTVVGTVDLSDRALATSAPALTTAATGTQPGHIIDPRSGQPGGRWNLVSVSDRHAAVADALSTAFCLLDHREMTSTLAHFPTARIEHLTHGRS